jgi:hypothetical protein
VVALVGCGYNCSTYYGYGGWRWTWVSASCAIA